MARKSKRVTLNEAIRQGQAKIAEGLKSGRMRSDNPHAHSSNKAEPALDTHDFMARPVAYGRGDLLKSKEIFLRTFVSGSKAKLVSLVLLALLAILALGIWIGNSAESIPAKDGSVALSPEKPVMPEEKSDAPESLSASKMPAQGQSEAAAGTVDRNPPLAASQGDNVIWIQSIPIDRKDDLKPVQDFFTGKGIGTEIIIDRNSGCAVLVTQTGFSRDPSKEGTEGYKLLQLIKQLGPVYVEQTQDTKFGAKPFQDALGYKR